MPLRPPLRRFLRVAFTLGPILVSYAWYRRTHRGREPTPREAEKLSRQAKALYRSLSSLGPAFIKLGQILSSRPDIFPPQYIRELEKLQDDVPPADFEVVRRMIEEDLGPLNTVFEWFNTTPIASASLGQVYEARYRGERVAVKVNRPHIRDMIEQDTYVLRTLLRFLGLFLDRNVAYSISSVVEDYLDHVDDEIDYLKEASNMVRIAEELKGENVVVPRVYVGLTTHRVLVMSYHAGVKISQVDELRSMGVDPQRLARRVSRLFIKMVLDKPIFHADPHPGNISVEPGGRIILYDYGMVGSLDQHTKKHLVRLYASFSLRDPRSIVDELVELGALDPDANRYVVERGFELAIRELGGETVAEWEFERLMELANRLIYRFPFKLPRQLVLYMRMAGILDGVCMKLDPDFNLLKIIVSVLTEEGYLDEVRAENIRSFISSAVETIMLVNRVGPTLLRRLEAAGFSNHSGGEPSRLILPSAILFAASLLYLHFGSSDQLPGYIGLASAFILLAYGALRRR
jgi:predicted unusual protein kinase regulating ubiquinone biosynthesis (AarF/ABC1/UbiB family)